MPPAAFEPATPTTDRLQTLALDSSASGIVGIRTRNPSERAPADPRLRKLGHWDRRALCIVTLNFQSAVVCASTVYNHLFSNKKRFISLKQH
jgi:hypothetical protein